MSRMIELIRESAVPANIMRSASRGALSLPPAEMIEILVHLAQHPIFGQQAQMTIAGWDEASSLAAVSDPNTPVEVLEYFSAPENLRPKLVPALLENPSIPDSRLLKMAESNSRGILAAMLASPRARSSASVLSTLAKNPALSAAELADVHGAAEKLDVPGDSAEDPEDVLRVEEYLSKHTDEIKEEEGNPFFLYGWTKEEQAELSSTFEPSTVGAITTSGSEKKAPVSRKNDDRERVSTVQKIARLSVGERVQLGMKGNRDERFILIRDGSKVVSSAVLESPKLTETEVEGFAAMKNVSESVLRGIASKRRFLKNYSIIRILTANPRCPLDVALPLLGHLLVMDLKNLSINKNVSDTMRKLALKMMKDKTQTR